MDFAQKNNPELGFSDLGCQTSEKPEINSLELSKTENHILGLWGDGVVREASLGPINASAEGGTFDKRNSTGGRDISISINSGGGCDPTEIVSGV